RAAPRLPPGSSGSHIRTEAASSDNEKWRGEGPVFGRNIAGNGWSTLGRPRGAWGWVARVQRIDRLRGVGPVTVSRGRGRRLPFSPQRRTAMPLQLSLAVCDYDRTRAIFDGRAAIEGCDLAAVPLEPEESFHRAFKFQEFDVSEISMSSYMVTTARGDGH